MTTAKRTISILGPGKVGTAIGVLSARAGYRVAMGGRNPARAARAARRIGPLAKAMTLEEAAAVGDVVLLTVPDDAIAPLCQRLAKAGAFRAGAVVAHCCGALGGDILKPAKRNGCAVGSMHPLQTFATVASAVAGMKGVYCFIEGDRPARAPLRKLAAAIGARPVQIAPKNKALYHAAAAMASNHLVSLMDAALAMGHAAGVPRQTFLKALAPLVRTTVENVLTIGPHKALTGPVARGDAKTLRRHAQALRGRSELAALYHPLARRTIKIAFAKGTIGPAAVRAMTKIIDREIFSPAGTGNAGSSKRQ